MAKAPVPGVVKTRLCPPYTHEQAAEIACALLEDTWHAASAMAGAKLVLVLSGALQALPQSLQHMDIVSQPDGDLGMRIEFAARTGLHRASPVLVLGSDAPGISVDTLHSAAALLGSRDVVLGPSRDGGFYLIGFSRWEQGMLKGLPWSSKDTLAATMKQLEARGFRVGTVASLDDVDTVEDVYRLRAQVAAGRVAPRTVAVLEAISGGTS